MEQGVSPKIWGPILWRVLYDLAWEYDHTYESNQEETMGEWIFALGQSLPCRFCRESFAIYSNEPSLPLALHQKTLFRWMHALKNKVNEKLRLQQAIESKCASKEEFLQVDRALNDLPFKVLVQRVRTNQFMNTRDQDRWMVMLLFTCNYAPRPEKMRNYMTLFTKFGISPLPKKFQDQATLFLTLYTYRPPCHTHMTKIQFLEFVKTLFEATSGFIQSTDIKDYQ